MRNWIYNLILALGIVLSGCSSRENKWNQILTIETERGNATFEVAIADTPEKQKQGLMYIRDLPEGRGMLFVFPTGEVRSFWMKNTYISLDIVFISSGSVIIDIAREARPMDESLITPRGAAQYVLEIGGGLAAKYGIQVGDKIILP